MANLKAKIGTPYLVAMLAAGIGVITCILPWYQFGKMASFISDNTVGLTHWRGTLSFICYLVALGLNVLTSIGMLKLEKKTVDLGLICCGAGAFLFTLLFFVAVYIGSYPVGISRLPWSPREMGLGPSVWSFLSLAAGAAIAIAGMLSQKDPVEKSGTHGDDTDRKCA